jgi:hypothetical protein
MRPCRHCNAPLENHHRRCPACGGEDVATVGLAAPELDEPTSATAYEDESREERLFRRVILACWVGTAVGVPFAGWLLAGPLGLMIGLTAIALILVYFQVFADASF